MEKAKFPNIEQTAFVNALTEKFQNVDSVEVRAATELCNGSNRAKNVERCDYFDDQDVRNVDKCIGLSLVSSSMVTKRTLWQYPVSSIERRLLTSRELKIYASNSQSRLIDCLTLTLF